LFVFTPRIYDILDSISKNFLYSCDRGT
jgi:hypothetical protein